MPDTFDASTRSTIMASVRGAGNASTERRLVNLFREHRITGWRRGVPLQGRPDFVFRAERIAIFVDGCFWHGCPRHRRVPVSRIEYWVPKLARNMQRDRAVTRTLRASGWTVLRIWECALARSRAGRTLGRIARALQKARAAAEPNARARKHRK
jgi:DNA mismatch endonuclease (patch repair protein)